MPLKMTSSPAPSTMMVGPFFCAFVVRIALVSPGTAPAMGEGRLEGPAATGAAFAGAAATAAGVVVFAAGALCTGAAIPTGVAAGVAIGVAAGVAIGAAVVGV